MAIKSQLRIQSPIFDLRVLEVYGARTMVKLPRPRRIVSCFILPFIYIIFLNGLVWKPSKTSITEESKNKLEPSDKTTRWEADLVTICKVLLTKVLFQERISLRIQDKDKGLKEVMMIPEANIAMQVKAKFFIKEEVIKDQLLKQRILSIKLGHTQDKTMILRVD